MPILPTEKKQFLVTFEYPKETRFLATDEALSGVMRCVGASVAVAHTAGYIPTVTCEPVKQVDNNNDDAEEHALAGVATNEPQSLS
jgi:hypothetical protein